MCMGGLMDDDFWGLECGHCFHKPCLKEYFLTAIKEKKFPIKCPSDDCQEEVCYQDLVEILDRDDLDKFISFTFNNYVDMNNDELSWCPTIDCKYVFALDKDMKEFLCPLCTKNYCLNCRVEFHKGMSCAEYKISKQFDEKDKLFIEFVKGNKFKQCPKCRFWVAKDSGCDWMKCRCGTEFCWKCGGFYGHCACGKAGIVPGHAVVMKPGEPDEIGMMDEYIPIIAPKLPKIKPKIGFFNMRQNNIKNGN